MTNQHRCNTLQQDVFVTTAYENMSSVLPKYLKDNLTICPMIIILTTLVYAPNT